MRDKRTPKDVCGEASDNIDEIQYSIQAQQGTWIKRLVVLICLLD